MPVPTGLPNAEYAQWLNQVRPRFGIFTDVFSVLGLFDVFNVWWIRQILGLSVVACTLDRWPRTWKVIRNPSARVEEDVFERAANRASFRLGADGPRDDARLLLPAPPPLGESRGR